ncbi:MAG: HTH-type transcriptional regulator PgrR [Candidatus Erwinia impunctatus]|nr:HTH-type transcriptional regulator PgrR [Culicoides impunctatus]
MPRIALPELSVFFIVAEKLNFSMAARELGVSTSALSHSIRKLEARIGVQLFTRTTRSVALTDAGEVLFRRAEPAISDLEQIIDELKSARDKPSGTIRISAAESGARPLIRHLLPEFLKSYPDIHVEFVIDTRYVDIVSDGFNAGIRMLEDVPLDMIAIPFGKEVRFAAVASPEYLAKNGWPESPEDLKKHQCIRFRFVSGALYHWDFEKHTQRTTLNVQGQMTLGNTNLMVDAALANIGIAWVPDYLIQEHIDNGSLIQLLAEWSPRSSRMCLYYPANRISPPALKAFCDAVRSWGKKQI